MLQKIHNFHSALPHMLFCPKFGDANISVNIIDCEEDEFCSMRDYLVARFWWDSSQNYLWYPVEMTP
jgi:hypothetical protein